MHTERSCMRMIVVARSQVHPAQTNTGRCDHGGELRVGTVLFHSLTETVQQLLVVRREGSVQRAGMQEMLQNVNYGMSGHG